NNAGIVDRDGNGIRQLSTGAPVAFQILAPSFTLDPRKTTIANDMQSQLRTAGLDVLVSVYDSWAALDAAAAGCTSCVYVKRYTAATQLPDWYYTVPELLAANDPLVNLHLNLGAATVFTLAGRQLHVGHVSHLAGVAADLIPVLHFDALEAFDFESFDGWVNTFGGINNFWSFTGLHLPMLGTLSATVDIFPTRSLQPGATTDVQVAVHDETGLGVSGVTVDLDAVYGTLTAVTGTTDASGIFRTTYTAPASVSTVQDDWVSATVWAGQYVGASASNSLSLHPADPGQLVVGVSRGTAPEIDSGGTATITVQVTDGANDVAGATVQLSTDLPGGSFNPSSGTTDANGMFTSTFTATVKQGMTYRIFADASKAGFEDGSNRLTPAALSVRSDIGTVPVIETTHNVPGFEAASAVGAVALVFALLAVARRRKGD
ncbi:MAG TPA: Ig-like domain-containing protein, partial [Thermoplasmata archaeon]|nr:Ig-like domain-containing protein [Thermoplasmata archaeon]